MLAKCPLRAARTNNSRKFTPLHDHVTSCLLRRNQKNCRRGLRKQENSSNKERSRDHVEAARLVFDSSTLRHCQWPIRSVDNPCCGELLAVLGCFWLGTPGTTGNRTGALLTSILRLTTFLSLQGNLTDGADDGMFVAVVFDLSSSQVNFRTKR